MPTTTSVGQTSVRQILVKGEAVYQCDVCKRKIRVPTNKYGIDVVQRCIITKSCLGKLHKVLTAAEANNTPAVPPAVANVEDWAQRRVYFLHEQTIANQTWSVEHNLGSKPSVQVFVTRLQDGEEVLVEVDPLAIRVIDLNTVEIDFTNAEKGQAQCLAVASANTVNPDATTAAETSEETTLLSNNGVLTIATLDDSSVINLLSLYRSANAPDGEVNVEYVGIAAQASIGSPWVGVNKVFVNGRSFTVRSFNLRTQPLASAVFNSNLIANGTQFNFPNITTPNQVLILLGTSPFTVVDRVVDRYIDVAAIDPDQPELLYTSGDAFAAASVVRTAYPHVFVVD